MKSCILECSGGDGSEWGVQKQVYVSNWRQEQTEGSGNKKREKDREKDRRIEQKNNTFYIIFVTDCFF